MLHLQICEDRHFPADRVLRQRGWRRRHVRVERSDGRFRSADLDHVRSSGLEETAGMRLPELPTKPCRVPIRSSPRKVYGHGKKFE